MEDKKYWLSIIISAHNCKDTIERLLDSILTQDMNDDIEVMISDDNSTDRFINKVMPYTDKLHIIYAKTEPREIHCPGNTRMDGWAHCSGEWITFIDHDDVFESNKFKSIKESMDANPSANFLFANFREFSEDQSTVLEEYKFQLTWMHGKFYKRNWLIENHIDFKENLITHEDLYFNSQVFASIYNTNESYISYNDFVYRWIYNPNSTSRDKYINSKDHLFLEDNFEDYITASYDSWMNIYLLNKDNIDSRPKIMYFNQFCSIILYYYFYYQGFIWLHREDKVDTKILEMIREKIYNFIEIFNITKENIIIHIHDIPKYYVDSKSTAQMGIGRFVESVSFDDFIRNL